MTTEVQLLLCLYAIDRASPNMKISSIYQYLVHCGVGIPLERIITPDSRRYQNPQICVLEKHLIYEVWGKLSKTNFRGTSELN